MNTFLHTNMKSILIGLMVSMASFLSPTVATGQTGFWTDEGNYNPDWPSKDDIDGDYYNIRNEADLAAFARLVNTGKETFKGKIVRVYNTHIDLKEHYWIPIGWDEKGGTSRKFEGTFDGMEHRFENICIDIDQMLTANMDVEHIGFFGYNYGTIKNVSLQSMQIRGTAENNNSISSLRIGGCAVYNKEGAIIENCIIFDDPEKVTEQASLVDLAEIDCFIGGICLENDGTIRKCRNEKPIEISQGRIGGIVNDNYGTLIECENSRSLRSPIVSGIACSNHWNGCISECTNSGDLYGGDSYGSYNSYGGGACGIAYNNGGKSKSYLSRVENCINTGKIEGGVAAGISIFNDGDSGEAQMRNNQNAGQITGKKAAGIVVENYDVLDGCINTGQVDGFYSAAGITCSSPTYVYSISNCENKGKITAINDGSGSVNQKAYAGGICADGLSINTCRNMGKVYASAPMYAYAGGILAYFRFANMGIAYCYNTASVSAVLEKGRSMRAYSGGIVGESHSSNNRIYNCFNSGKISCENKTSESDVLLVAGGILGNHLSGPSKVTVSNSYNTGDILTKGAKSYACAIGGGEINASFNTGSVNVYGLSNAQDASTIAYGIGSNPTNCLSLGKNISSTNYAYKVGDNKVKQGNYASSLLKIEDKDGDCSAREGIYENGDYGKFWYLDMAAPLDAWLDEAWDKSDNTILPQLKYADGTLMPDQPRLLKSDYATETPSDPSDATLKSLSYKIGQDGQEIAVPGFRPDSSRYQISYQPGQAGSNFYAVGESVNAEAKVTNGYGELGENFAMVDVTPAEGSDRRYSIFGVEAGDEDKYYLVLHLGEHLAFWIDGKEYRGDTVYKAVPEKAITGRLVPDKGYKLPDEFWHYDGGMAVFVPKGTEWYTNDGEIPLSMLWHCALTAFAQEGEETDPLPVGSKLTVEPFVYEVLSENRVKLLHPVRTTEIWTVASCEVPDSVTYEGYRYQVTKIAASALAGYTTLKSITLPEGLLSIGAFAFDDCGLTRLHLPASVTFIGDEEGDWDLFGYCPNLQAVTVADGSKTYSASDSILYNKDRSRLILCPPAYPHSEVRVPDEVKEIMPYAFAYGKNVACLTLPAGLEKIREFAFSSSALTKGNGYIRCLGEQPVTFEDTEFLLLLSSTQAEEDHLLVSNNGKYPCTLYVPAGAKAAYEAAFFWKNFPITEELPSSGEVTITGKDEIKVGEEATKIEDGVIGNDDLPTVLERISIDIRSSSSQTTTLTFKQVTVGDGQIVTEETTTTTEIKEETNVSITIEGENVLGKLVNNGIAELLTDSKDGSLSNTLVVNYNTFTSETKLVNKVEGTAPLDVTDPENKTVVAGSSTTLVASTTVESSFSLTFVWERWVDGHWETVEERKYENLLRSSADKQEDKLTVSAADAGLYRCRITNTVGDASTTLITAPAEVKLTSSGGDPTPPFTPDATYYDIVLPQVTGATINPAAGKHSVKEGDSFSFTLTLDAGYDQSKPEVKAGDEVLVADANGKYTIANVRGDLTITITDITLNNPTANAEIDQAVKVWAEGHTLYVYTAERETIRLYSFSGQLLKQVDNAGRIAITGLPEGNYLIRIGNRTWKIAL